MRRDRWRIIFDPRMRCKRKRKIEGLDLREVHGDENVNDDDVDVSVHRHPKIVSRIRESKPRHFKKSLSVPKKQAELVSAKGAYDIWGMCVGG